MSEVDNGSQENVQESRGRDGFGPGSQVESQESSATSQETKQQVSSPDKTASADVSANGTSPEDKLRKAAFREAKEWKNKHAETERKYNELNDRLNKLQSQNPNQSQIAPDQAQALRQLAQLMRQDPESLKILGLDRIDSIEQTNKSYFERQSETSFRSEWDEMLSLAEKSGLDKDEVDEEMAEYISEHPFFSKKDYAKGMALAAFKDHYFSQMDKLKERQANLKLIEEREKAKKANSEGGNRIPAGNPSLPGKGETMSGYLRRTIQEAGGVSAS